MQLVAPALVCAVRAHGETAAIARLLTERAGLIAAYVAGGRGRQLRPVLIPGNAVSADLRARAEGQLPFARIELAVSRAPCREGRVSGVKNFASSPRSRSARSSMPTSASP